MEERLQGTRLSFSLALGGAAGACDPASAASAAVAPWPRPSPVWTPGTNRKEEAYRGKEGRESGTHHPGMVLLSP